MNGHPTREEISEFAWEALEGSRRDEVGRHVAACGECARLAARCRAESERIAAACGLPVDAGLVNRILDASTPGTLPSANPRPWGFALSSAAAAAFAALSLWAWQGRSEALRRAGDLEREVARLERRPEPRDDNDIDALMNGLCRAQVESSIAELVAWADLPDRAATPLRETLRLASDTTREVLARSSRGEIDYGQLRTVDTLAGLDDHLKAALDTGDFEIVTARLGRRSRDTAESAARSLVLDLQARAALDQAQANQIQSLLVDRTSWRRDLPFLPEVARDALFARQLGGDGALRPEFAALLEPDQQVRVLEFIASAETARSRYWEQLRTSHPQ